MLLQERMKLIGWFLSHDLLCACGILKSLDVFISMWRGRAWKKRARRFHYERAYRASTFEITNLSAQKTRYVNGPLACISMAQAPVISSKMTFWN